MSKQVQLTKIKKTLEKERVLAPKQLDKNLVQRCAYEIFEERMQQNIPGDHLADWLKAEEELRSSVKTK
jgi:hypothetical protein